MTHDEILEMELDALYIPLPSAVRNKFMEAAILRKTYMFLKSHIMERLRNSRPFLILQPRPTFSSWMGPCGIIRTEQKKLRKGKKRWAKFDASAQASPGATVLSMKNGFRGEYAHGSRP